MTIPYADQSASGLRFYLMKGSVDVEQYNVLARQKLLWGNESIELGILGASHFVRIDTSDGYLNEIFACAEIETDLPQIKAGPLGDLPAEINTQVQGFKYSFVPRLVCWDDGACELNELMSLVKGAKSFSNHVGLEFKFPGQVKKDRPPVTLVWGCVEKKQLQVKTLHAYPNEDMLVFTETNIQKGEQG